MGGGRMRRIRERLSQALKPNSSPSAMVCSESQNFGRSRNCLSSHDAMRLRCSRSACCVMNDSISELAERLEENGIIDEEGKEHSSVSSYCSSRLAIVSNFKL
ncbi:hypothetical protein TTRE_0000049601 [Trichuris trichiura]|uniref:Uncharacterized protein n=1 Tax=Trichuris trichiura TaxID=36087 RepID=A0A077YW18_TRITR|nr:hypothetical protein TTRE_0000049601 [Trichuris trichiura]